MTDLSENKDDIVKLMFWFNIITLFILIFYFKLWVFIIVALINIMCLGSFLIIKKNNLYFDEMKKQGKTARRLDKKLGAIYG